MTPFCDYLNVSFPQDVGLATFAQLGDVLDAALFDRVRDASGTFLYRSGSGTVKCTRRGHVAIVGSSGTALRTLRDSNLYGDFLGTLALGSHRVTRLDCTVDIPVDAAPIVEALMRKGRCGRVALSRKAVAIEDVYTHLGLDRRGVLTGSVYFGAHTAEVRGLVYDKRHQLECKMGADIGPCTRYEIRVSGKFGPTLHDAYAPARLFWHFASPDLLRGPDGVQPWVSHSEGFVMPPSHELTPAQLMQRKLESSPDVARLLALAKQIGPYGMDLLCQRLRRLADSSAVGSSAPAPGQSPSLAH